MSLRLFHYYELEYGPFRSLSALPPEQAEAVLAEIRQDGQSFAAQRNDDYLTTGPRGVDLPDGIAIGFISYAVGKLLTGRPKQCPLLVYIFAVLFVLRYLLVGKT